MQCVICTELMSDDGILSYLECGHVYHQTCLDRWTRTMQTCPECRIAITKAPRRLYLHFTDQPDLDEITKDISQKNGFLEKTIATLQEQKTKGDHILRLSLAQITKLVNSNVRIKRALLESETCGKLSTAKVIQLTRQLKEQTEQREALSIVVESLRAHGKTMNEKLKENRISIDQMKDTIRTMDKAQADRIIENCKLELEKGELYTRLDQFRTEFVRANNELQELKSENENLKNELTVQKAGKQSKLNVNEKLEKTDTLFVMENDNATTTTPNDATDADLWKLRADTSHKPITMTVYSGQGEASTKKGLVPKRKSGEIIGAENNTKYMRLMPQNSQDSDVNKIVIVKSSAGWSVVPQAK